MKKLMLILSAILLVSVVFTTTVVLAEDPDVLAEDTYGVVTSAGVLTFPEGTIIGGNPTNYIILTEDRAFLMEGGYKEYQKGTVVNCDPEPGYPNPCGAS